MHCACFLFMQNTKFRPSLVQPSASLNWQPTSCQTQRCTDVELDLCQFEHKMRRSTRVLLANIDLCDAEKLRRTCHGVDFVCSRSRTTHRRISAIPSQFPAEFCHLNIDGRATFHVFLQPSHEHHIWDDLGCWSIIVLSARPCAW